MVTDAATRFDGMLHALAEIFEREGRPGGLEAAAALRGTRPDGQPLEGRAFDFGPLVHAALTGADAVPEARAIADAADLIFWRYSGLEDGRIPERLASFMITAELIGPTGMLHHDTVRVGLFLQSPRLTYPTRIHSAEETFYILGGTADWQAGAGAPAPCPPGSYVHHPSSTPHASITGEEPTIAAWRWTGEISFDHYSLEGAEAGPG